MTQTTAAIFAPSTEAASRSKTFSTVAKVARVLLGAIFFVFGLNGFLHFIPMPPPTGTAAEFSFGLAKSGYFFPLMSALQVVGGALLLAGSLVPFALLLLFPISLNILFFHLALAPAGIGLAAVVIAAHILLAVYYWPVYKPIFQTGNAWMNK